MEEERGRGRSGEKGGLLTMIATKLWAVKVVRNKIVVNCVDIKRNVYDKGEGDRGQECNGSHHCGLVNGK